MTNIDAQASLLMEEGIRLMQSGNGAQAALLCFDRALELRRLLPLGAPTHAYGLAACWLNRGEALTLLGARHAEALCAYDEALALLRLLPLSSGALFSKRLAIAHQNRALSLAAQNPPLKADAVAALIEAIAVLDQAATMPARERDSLLAVVWMNLANIQASEDAARRALVLVKAYEYEDDIAAEAGLKARHVLCRILAHRLSARAENQTDMAAVHDATDLTEEGLRLVRDWERRGNYRFRSLAPGLFHFGARVYAQYQPHFLGEFVSDPSMRPYGAQHTDRVASENAADVHIAVAPADQSVG